MRLQWPIDGITNFPPISPNGSEKYVSQRFGAVWISDRDQVINGIQIKKGDNVYLKTFGWLGHNGVDIAAPKGTVVKAAHDGWIVQQEAKDAGYGIRITQRFTVDGKDYVFVYGHLNATERPFDIAWNWNLKDYPVKRGQVIGYVNSTGFSTGNHLHWGFYQYSSNGVKLNGDNGFGGGLDPVPLIGSDMDFYQIGGEQTVVVKVNGKYFPIATPPELYPFVKRLFNIPDVLQNVDKAEVEANKGGIATASLGFSQV